MGYYTDFWIKIGNNEPKRLASATGSDTPGYMGNIKNELQYLKALNELKEEAVSEGSRGFWGEKFYPFPWKNSKTCDWCFLLVVPEKRFINSFLGRFEINVLNKSKLYVAVKHTKEGNDFDSPVTDFIPWDDFNKIDFDKDHYEELERLSSSIIQIEMPNTK